jgi:hypothetical protein
MCVDCWNAGMAAPAAIVAGRFAWVGYRDRIPFVRRRSGAPSPDGAEAPDGPLDGAPLDDAPPDRADDAPIEVGAGSP